MIVGVESVLLTVTVVLAAAVLGYLGYVFFAGFVGRGGRNVRDRIETVPGAEGETDRRSTVDEDDLFERVGEDRWRDESNGR